MADARNYKQYRIEVLNRLGVQYYDEDIEDFDRWRLKVLQGLSDLYGEENIINAINAWLDEHGAGNSPTETGEITVGNVSAGTTLNKYIEFSGTYSSAPSVTFNVGARGDSYAYVLQSGMGNITTSGVQIYLNNPSNFGVSGVFISYQVVGE